MNPPRPACSQHTGATLVEVLVSILLIGALAVAGSAHLHLARAGIYIQADRETALETAAERLEVLRAERFSRIQPPDEASYYLAPSGTTWVVHSTDPGETVDLGSFLAPMRTRIQWGDLQPGTVTNSYLQVTVEVTYRKGRDDSIRLQSLVAP